MPIADKIFHPKMPQPYRQFLSNLWDDWRHPRLVSGWLSVPIGNHTILEEFAGSELIGKIAAKAYRTASGRQIMEKITEVAGRLPGDIKLRPSVRESEQIRYLERVSGAIYTIINLLKEDLLPDEAHSAVSAAKEDIMGTPIYIRRCFPMLNIYFERPEENFGSVSLYGLTHILESLVAPIGAKIDELRIRHNEIKRGYEGEKIVAFSLSDSLDYLSSDFKSAGKLEPRPIVVAFFSVLCGHGSAESFRLKTRVYQLLDRRKKFRTRRPFHAPDAK